MKVSPVENAPELVSESVSGHLFLINDSNKCQEQHDGLFPIDESVAKSWVSHILSMSALKKEHPNLAFCFLPAPDKQSVYWHEISERLDCRNILAILEKISSDLYLDPLPILTKLLFEGVDVYPKVDTHWNSLGAQAVFFKLLEKWDIKIPQDFFENSLVKKDTFGDLGRKLNPKRSGENAVLNPVLWKKKMLYDNAVPDNGRIRIFSNQDAPIKKRLVFVGDSFSYRIVELASLVFRDVFHFHGSFLDRGYFRIIQPDYLVFEQTERFFIRSPQFNMDNYFDRLLEKKIEANVDLSLVVQDGHFFNPSLMSDLNQMLVIAMSEKVLVCNGVLESSCVSPSSSSLLRILKSRV